MTTEMRSITRNADSILYFGQGHLDGDDRDVKYRDTVHDRERTSVIKGADSPAKGKMLRACIVREAE